MTWAGLLELAPFLKVIGAALALAWGWFMVHTKNEEKQAKNDEKQRRIHAEKKVEEHENQKQYQASEISRLEASKVLANKRSDKLLEKLKSIDPAHLNDVELDELYANPLGESDIPTNPERVVSSEAITVRKR